MLFVLACSLQICAQNISVASFTLLENDLTANTTGTMERDQNGEIAALIKVVTTEQGFVFDGGMTGIVKTKQEVGEVWVYVPHGIKKMTIKHPQLGVLRDYFFPIPIDKAKTYELKLTTGKVETIITRSANKQYVIFNVNPANAIVELDNMPLDVSGDGYAEKAMLYGTYNYRVSSANYHTEAGRVTVSSQGKSEVNVSLRPNFGWIDINGSNEYHGAHVYVDNEHIGLLPVKSDGIKSGTHQVKVMKSLYKPYELQVTVTDDNTTSLMVELVPNFANVTLTTDSESEIWVDGKQRGKGQCIVPLEIGEYTVEVKRASHRTIAEVVTISSVTERTIQLPSPTPIYGTLNVTSTPSRATVYIDSVKVGETPLIKSDVLVGIHQLLVVRKDGASECKQMEIQEGLECQLVLSLGKDSLSVESKDSLESENLYQGSIKRTERKNIRDVIKLYKGKDYKEAIKEFSIYAEQKNSYAQYYLGECYFYGRGTSIDYVKAMNWYRESAKQDNASAQYKIGYCYEMGKGVTKNRRKAIMWYRKAAKRNGKARYKAEIFG